MFENKDFFVFIFYFYLLSFQKHFSQVVKRDLFSLI